MIEHWIMQIRNILKREKRMRGRNIFAKISWKMQRKKHEMVYQLFHLHNLFWQSFQLQFVTLKPYKQKIFQQMSIGCDLFCSLFQYGGNCHIFFFFFKVVHLCSEAFSKNCVHVVLRWSRTRQQAIEQVAKSTAIKSANTDVDLYDLINNKKSNQKFFF